MSVNNKISELSSWLVQSINNRRASSSKLPLQEFNLHIFENPQIFIEKSHSLVKVLLPFNESYLTDSMDAVTLYKWTDYSFCLYRPEIKYPQIKELCSSLKLALKNAFYDITEVTSNAYISKEGEGVDWHYDNHNVLIIQLSGRKQWTYLNNLNLVPSKNRYASRSESDNIEKSEELEQVLLEGGDVLYIPKGCWHKTRCTVEHSLSLSITVQPTSLKDLLFNKLEEHFEHSAYWNEPVCKTRIDNILELNILVNELEKFKKGLQ